MPRSACAVWCLVTAVLAISQDTVAGADGQSRSKSTSRPFEAWADVLRTEVVDGLVQHFVRGDAVAAEWQGGDGGEGAVHGKSWGDAGQGRYFYRYSAAAGGGERQADEHDVSLPGGHGILYVCYGRCFEHDPIRVLWKSAMEARRHISRGEATTPAVRLGIVLDREPPASPRQWEESYQDVFDDIIVVPSLADFGGGWLERMVAWLHTPYQVTLTVDSDTWLCAHPGAVFREADALFVDIAMADHTYIYDNYLDGESFPDNGVVLYRRSAGGARALQLALHEYVRQQDPTLSDQLIFRMALVRVARSRADHELIRQARFNNAVGYRMLRDAAHDNVPLSPGADRWTGHDVLGPVYVVHVRALIDQDKQQEVCVALNARVETARVLVRTDVRDKDLVVKSMEFDVVYNQLDCTRRGFRCVGNWQPPHQIFTPNLPGPAPWLEDKRAASKTARQCARTLDMQVRLLIGLLLAACVVLAWRMRVLSAACLRDVWTQLTSPKVRVSGLGR